jgi:hypothetical protein
MDQNGLYKMASFCEIPKPKFPSTKRCHFGTKRHGPVGERVIEEDGIDRVVLDRDELCDGC